MIKNYLLCLIAIVILLNPSIGISEEKKPHRGGLQKNEWNYEGGKKEGISKEYDHQGRLIVEWNYHNDQLDGISKRYYKSGKLMEELNYKDGKKEGESKIYYENGGIHYIETYQSGTLINKIEYDEQGKEK